MEAVLATRPRTFGQPAALTVAPAGGSGMNGAAASVLKRLSKPMLSLVSDVQRFQGVEGPFAPFAGSDSLTFGGSLHGLARTHGVIVPELKDVPEEGVIEATDAVGHTWYIRCVGDWMVSAFRELTAKEIEERTDRWEESLLSGIPKIRVLTCRRIALELIRLAEATSPDRCPPRSARRLLKRQIIGLANVQFDLLYSKAVPMADIRTRMKALGFERLC